MSNIKTADLRMRELLELAKTVAQSKATVLIQGESGTGKELLANAIHQDSARNSRPFIALNCAAIPENLLESELFGYERGAFTGAMSNRAGKFELANGGTILLDEISEMDIRLQAKLLRVIQEGEVDRIGGKNPIPVNVRVIATTNKNLSDCVREGSFRQDLYYRLNVVNLTIPPLRERMGDVSLLAKSFVLKFSEANGKQIEGFSDDATRLMDSYNWPGNVRELENVVERAVITARGVEIVSSDLQMERKNQALLQEVSERSQWEPGETLDDIERNVIIKALQYHNGNRTHTARALGISIRTLRNKLADYRQLGIQI